jgi:site-specific recombinase XerD
LLNVERGRPMKLPPEVYTPDEMNRRLAQCTRRAPTGIRGRALLTIIERAGLRISEALNQPTWT